MPSEKQGHEREELVQQQKILILAAIPYGLRLDKEMREIREAIERAARRDLFEIRDRTAVRPADIRRAIAEEQPQIVHFCGHGLEDGSLLLEDEGGNNKPVLPEALASLFRLHADYVKCVLLNACYSEKPAVAISQYVNYAIGMNQPIQDRAAIEFARGFYDGLGYKISGNQDVFQRAFDEGMVAIQMEDLSQGSIPVFKKKLQALTCSKLTSIQQKAVEVIETKNILPSEQYDLSAEPNKEVTARVKLKPSLRKYRFEYAEVELKSSGLFGLGKKPIINSRRKEVDYFIEDLGGGVELEMIAIKNGNFFMGSPEETNTSSSEFPQHLVSVNSFFIGKHPITQKQWKAVACLPQINRSLVADCSKFKGDNYPVEQVCWDDAVEFCDRLSQKTGRCYRLPSEAEWEYAARAGTTTLFHFGDIITSELANYKDCEDPKSARGVFNNQTTPVDNFKFANVFGLYDMHGLVWEWCMDHWHDSYKRAPNNGTAWLNDRDSQLRVIRGGSWADPPGNCRSASRKKARIDERANYLGFRVVCS